jgi:hypothetical protein
MATVAAALLASGCGAAEQASAPQPATTAEQAIVRKSGVRPHNATHSPRDGERGKQRVMGNPLVKGRDHPLQRDRAVRNNTPLCPRPTAARARIPTQEKAAAALRAAMHGADCGTKTPLVCPRPTAVPTRPKVPTLVEAETTLRAAMKGVECDADAVLAAQFFLEALAEGRRMHEVRPEDLHMTDESLPACKDDHLPDNAPTTPEEAEAMPDPPEGTECDASRGGTVTLCKGRHTNCVVVGEYTGPPIE